MDYLEIVQKAMERALVREDTPSTLAGATGIVKDFMGFVDDTYRNIQTTAHGERWFFRQALDQTLSLSTGTSSYAMPTGLTSLNWRTVTVYLTAKIEETPVEYIDYYEWRIKLNTIDSANGRPQYITKKPDGTLELYPAPDQDYTLHFDGVYSVDTLVNDADEPLIPEADDWQWVLVWGAVKRFAKRHEDGSLYNDANDEYSPLYDSMVNRQTPDVGVVTGHLYNSRVRLSRTQQGL